MDYDQQCAMYARNGVPDGVWHSHPNGDPTPSPADLEYHPKGMRMLIVAGGEVHDHGIPG
jgi:proteasome lid subunit RPN8/RPN11